MIMYVSPCRIPKAPDSAKGELKPAPTPVNKMYPLEGRVDIAAVRPGTPRVDGLLHVALVVAVAQRALVVAAMAVSEVVVLDPAAGVLLPAIGAHDI